MSIFNSFVSHFAAPGGARVVQPTLKGLQCLFMLSIIVFACGRGNATTTSVTINVTGGGTLTFTQTSALVNTVGSCTVLSFSAFSYSGATIMNAGTQAASEIGMSSVVPCPNSISPVVLTLNNGASITFNPPPLLSGVPFATLNRDGATFVSQSVPYEMASANSGSPVNGPTYNVSVTFLNSGTTTWTSANYKLGAQSKNYVCAGAANCVPTNAATWGLSGRVYLNPGEQIAPGQQKTFNFTVQAPTQSIGALTPIYNFQWQMVNEGIDWFGDATPNIPVTVLVAPAVAKNVAINVPPVSSPALNFNNFRGANVKELIYDPNNPYFAWFPSAEQMRTISQIAAQDMQLKIFRLPVFLPTQAATAADTTLMPNVIAQTRSMLQIANESGIKVIVELDGYLQSDQSCGVKSSLEDVWTNAQTLVQSLSSSPALYAWDLANEPMWGALNPAMLNGSNQLETGGPSICMSPTPTDLQNGDPEVGYQKVYDAVRSMYNLVRTFDPAAMTTVGENQLPYQAYWNDISSFASPHLYIMPSDITNAASNSSAIPSSVPVNTQIQMIEAGTISQLQLASTTPAGPLPLVIGEYGWSIPSYTASTQACLYESFYQTLQAENVGSMFWDLSLGYGATNSGAPQFYSLLQSVVATDPNALGSAPVPSSDVVLLPAAAVFGPNPPSCPM